jgi:DNA repair protein RecO (recombination protein O)
MEWSDDGIVLGTRHHGEASVILEVMTPQRGRHLGLVRGGAGPRARPVLQPGNSVQLIWRARLDEHLGHFSVEGLNLRAAAFLSAPHALYGVTHLAALCRLLPERDPHGSIYDSLLAILDHMGDIRTAAVEIARFELHLLAELGFGLDLDRCAVTGAPTDLVYVSPKSGRAVSRDAGAPWHDRLLQLPAFLHDAGSAGEPSAEELAAGFALTGFFLTRFVLEPRATHLPEARSSFIAAVTRPRPARAAS